MLRAVLYIAFILFSFLILTIANTVYAVLPDTGQTKCYNNTVEISCPEPGQPFYGQDGNYQGIQPSYQVSADGLVITDLNTGLMWQRSDDGVTRDHVDSANYCIGLNLGGYSDWRIPTRHELAQIVDYGRNNPAINQVFSCRDSEYWTGDKSVWILNYALAVSFSNGYVVHTADFYLFFVRCVRTGP
jgi:hypothetical protein